MGKRVRSLGELELEVLKIIWNRQPCTVQEVAEILDERSGYARTTVLTIMQRLHAKGFLTRRKQGAAFRYSATENRKVVMSGLIRQFVDTVLDSSPLPMVAYLSESKNLTQEQIASLREIVEKLESQSEEAKS
jgi:predicted transcriptional regulator